MMAKNSGFQFLRLILLIVMLTGMSICWAESKPSDLKFGASKITCPGFSPPKLQMNEATLAMELDLSALQLEIPAAGGKASQPRISCSIAIPLNVPEKTKVSNLFLQLQGEAKLVGHAQAKIAVSSFFAGSSEKSDSTLLTSKENGDFLVTSSPKELWSECGSQPILRVHFSVFIAQKNPTDRAHVKLLKLGSPPKQAALMLTKC